MTKVKKVLIADDERLVRVGLMHTVDWARWNMEVVANAPNGDVAWELYLEHNPDLVITDIVMPGMDGLQLTQKIKSKNPDTKILILSCHSDFAYAQQGLELGASGYLLKTAMDTDEVDRYLRKITEEWNRILTVEAYDPNALYRTWFKEGRNEDELNKLIRTTLEQTFDGEAIIFGVFDLHEEKKAELIASLAAHADKEEAASMLLDADEAPLLYIVPANAADRWMLQLIKQRNNDNRFLWKRTEALGVNENFMEEVQRLMKIVVLERQYEIRTEAVSAPIMEAVMYMDSHLHEPIVSSQLAERVGLSRSHFSTLFKKELGISFLDFLHRKRMRKASELLLETDWRINLIGEKVGMEDNKHFSKWFKRNAGMTPSEYRENKMTTIANVSSLLDEGETN